MFRYVEAPHDLDEMPNERLTVFLGGSIELGKADNWQNEVKDFLNQHPYSNFIDVFNPRREGPWEQEWMNDYSEGPFKEQVDWELHKQKECNLLIYYFARDTISPISLLELGLFYKKKPIVAADPGYLRLGNLMITKEHFNFEVVLGWNNFIDMIDHRVNDLMQRIDH